MSHRCSRRRFMRHLGAATGAGLLAGIVPRALGFESPNARPRLGLVGCGSRWGWQLASGGTYGVGPDFTAFGDYVAVCDVDRRRRDAAAMLVEKWGGAKPDAASDYRAVLERDDIDAVLCFTPDHWHAKIAIEAMLAGKDVYCEKPMTLTIEEGRQIGDVCRRTGQVMQVGTQQRSDTRFLTAIALIRAGRLGRLQRIECGIAGAPTSPAIPLADVPAELDWNQWLGPAPEAAYRALSPAPNEVNTYSRCHYEFRWWYEYSGGKLTDWGAHHVDIATWGLGELAEGHLSVEPVVCEHPVPFANGYPLVDDRYNTATKFDFKVAYRSGVELRIRSHARNGILFEGDQGRIFVSRGNLTGAPLDRLKDDPLPEGALEAVY
ncbi:MAG: Gfo/Idh/MocA family protein, partial [Planctomycetota bacterium]